LSIKSRKLFAILVVTMMVLSLLPMTAFAASDNSVNKVPQVASDHVFTDKTAPVLRIAEKNIGEFSSTSGETFRLILENAKWSTNAEGLQALQDKCTDGRIEVVKILSDTVAEITVVRNSERTDKATFLIPLITELTAEGEAKVTVDGRDSAVSSTTHVFANSAGGRTIASISKVNTIARLGKLATIQIDETRLGSLPDGEQNLKIKLPPKFRWELPAGWGADDDVTFSGGLTGTYDSDSVTGDGTRTLEITFNPYPSAAKRTARGSIFLNNLQIRADRDAPYGEVSVDFDGTNITSQELVVAKYYDYNIEASVEEVKEVVAGRHNNKTAKITIEENMEDALIEGRELSVVLPDWVKVTKISDKGTKVVDFNDNMDSNQSEFYFTVDRQGQSGKAKYVFELELSVEADKTGDIVAEISGAGAEAQELVIATAVAPVTVEINPTDLRIGVQGQEAPDIIITETAKGRIDCDGDLYSYQSGTDATGKPIYSATGVKDQLTISLPDGFEFTDPPTVEVTEGNLELAPLAFDPGFLTLKVKSASTRPSTIKISNIKLTLNRTVAEGDFRVNVGGGSIVKNHWKDATASTPGLFNKDRVVRALFGKVITPAPGETRATTTFTIDSTTYTVVENNVAVEKTMDVAPYLKNGRTYLPVRFVADALGVSEDNIVWDPVKASVTVFKGDRIAQMTIGSNVLMVNGVELTMDAVPEITNGRTMLPVRWVAQALGATIDWDADTQTVTVKQ